MRFTRNLCRDAQGPRGPYDGLPLDCLGMPVKDATSTCVAIRNAQTPAEVVAALRDYVAALNAAGLALVPSMLLTVGVDHAREIAQAALELARREAAAAANDPDAAILKEAAMVFSTAAMRLAVLSVGQQSATA